MAKRVSNDTWRYPARFGLVATLCLFLGACGIGDDDDPEATATSDPALESQPTPSSTPSSEPTEEASPEPSFILIPPSPETTGESETSTPETEPTEDVETDATPEDEAEPTDTADEPETPDAGPTAPPQGTTGSDGTSGANVANELLGTPSASPVSSPAPDENVDATEVDSCDVVEGPPFSGGSSSFVVIEEVNFRIGPGADCDLVLDGSLNEGVAMTVVSDPVVRSDDEDGILWSQVQVDGDTGWVATEFIEPAE